MMEKICRRTVYKYSDRGNSRENDERMNDATAGRPMSVLSEEVREAVRRLPKGKASGINNLPAELIKLDSDTVTHHHHHHNGLAMAPLNRSSAAPYKVCLVKVIN